jgi:PAS domain S-box-containing protein
MNSDDQAGARELLALIVESSDDAIISKTMTSVITSWNKGAERIFGYTAEEAIGQSILMLIPPDRRYEESLILARLSRGERIEHYETVRRRKDGMDLEISLTISPIKDASGRIVGASKIARDVTERKRIERVAQETAARLGMALQASRMGNWSWDVATDLVTMSDRAAEIFGIPPGPVMTWTQMRQILSEEDRERARVSVERAIADHTDYDIEYQVVQPGDRRIWVAAMGRATYDESGQVLGMLGVVQDVTERKLERAQLEAEREALETINRVGQMLSAELNLDKLVQALTDAATEITGAEFGSFFYNVIDERGGSYMLYTLSGVPREQFANFPMPRATDLFGPTFRGEGVVRIDDVKKDPRHGANAPYYGMPKGHLPVVSYLAVPVISRSGEVIGGLFFGHSKPGVFTERDERIVAGLAGLGATAMDNARLYVAEQKARRDAETANRLKDEFLATVSHELRTPLNAITGWALLLRSGKLDPASSEQAIETIERNAKAQEQIIEDILDVSRIITGKIRLDVSTVEVAPVIDAAVDSLRLTADARQPSLVLGDAGRLQQVVWNLLSNAIKFTPRGGRVQVALERINSHIEIKVTDTGQGINKEFLPYVFERFRQADSSTAREYGGLGLGLAIVRHLTELHGGSVSADSAGEGLGATFTVRLPVAAAREDSFAPTQTSVPRFHQPLSEEAPTEFTEELAGVRVLVVDDEPDARVLLTTMLRQYGAEATAAGSTSEALETLKGWLPDVLVSDIGMPGRDGYELIREVRALSSEEGGDTPAVALTAYARSEDRLKALRSGFHTHLSKPVTPTELSATIAGLVRSYKRKR